MAAIRQAGPLDPGRQLGGAGAVRGDGVGKPSRDEKARRSEQVAGPDQAVLLVGGGRSLLAFL